MTDTTSTPTAPADLADRMAAHRTANPPTTPRQVKAAVRAIVTAPAPDFGPYMACDKSGRAAVRKQVGDVARATLATATDLDGLAEAQRLMAITFPTVTGTRTRPESDPAEVIAARIVALRLAADLLESGMAAPDGMEVIDFGDTNPRDLAGPVDVSGAWNLATAKVGRAAPTYKVEDGLRAAFDGEPIGTVLRVSEVCNRWHAAGGPDKANGRVSARLFAEGGCTITWVEPVPGDSDGPNRVRLIAEPPTA